MSRTIKQIYEEAVAERNKRLELSEFNSDSKMSIMNGLTWAFAAVIFSFEVLLDVFILDVSVIINNRINGTPAYYAHALLNFQKGDELSVREDGLAFGYANIDEEKKIITQVSYTENSEDGIDKLVLKVATGDKGKLKAITEEELVMVRSYINKIKFAGTRIEVTSQNGDILVPRISVFYNGGIRESELYDNIVDSLNEYIMQIDFDAAIYVSKILETIKKVEHVTDVYIDHEKGEGIYLARYDSDGKLLPLEKVSRMVHTSSGYIRESSKTGMENEIPGFKDSIKLIVDN